MHRTPPGDAAVTRHHRTPRAIAVVLAAGRGRRFGATKQLVSFRGEPLVAHAVRCARESSVQATIVVVGHEAARITAAVRCVDPKAQIVLNNRYDAGMGASLAAGVRAARQQAADAIVVLLADQPLLPARTLSLALEPVLRGMSAARVRYRDRPGHPTAFHRRVLPLLADLSGDRGARDVLRRIHTVEVPWPATEPGDIDDPGQLWALSAAR